MDKAMAEKWQKTERNPVGKSSVQENTAPAAPALPDELHLSRVTTQTDRFRTPQPFSVSGSASSSKFYPGAALQQGSTFGEYVILKRLSAQKDKLTFLVTPENNTHLPENPDTAVLKLYPAPDDPEKFSAMMKKVSALSLVQEDSACITPKILSSGTDSRGYCWYISKYMEIPSMESFIQAKAPLNEHKALYTIYTLASLLDKGYSLWGAHGRLKPSQILFGLKKAPLFLGMGQSSFLQQNGKKMLPDENFFYASPEYITNGEISWQSDMYSLGIIFFRLLSGVLPFYSPDTGEVKKAHLTATLPPLSDKNPAVRVSIPTLGILNRMTMKDPAKRFLSRQKLLEALIQADDALPKDEKD